MTEHSGDQNTDFVYAFAASPRFAQDGVCFAACKSGLYCSVDGGNTWASALDSLALDEPLAITAVAVTPASEAPGTVFAGTQGAVLRSPDGGTTWHVAVFSAPSPTVVSFAVSPQYDQDGTIVAGTLESGIFVSTDRGNNWAAWNFGLVDLNVLCLAISPEFSKDETIYAGTSTGLFRSTNGGRAWREVNVPLDLPPVLSIALSPRFSSDKMLLIGTESDGVFISTDAGKIWDSLGQATNSVNSILLSQAISDHPDLLLLVGERLLISHDIGQTWDAWTLPEDIKITAVVAPEGLQSGAQAICGAPDGSIFRVTLPPEAPIQEARTGAGR